MVIAQVERLNIKGTSLGIAPMVERLCETKRWFWNYNDGPQNRTFALSWKSGPVNQIGESLVANPLIGNVALHEPHGM